MSISDYPHNKLILAYLEGRGELGATLYEIQCTLSEKQRWLFDGPLKYALGRLSDKVSVRRGTRPKLQMGETDIYFFIKPEDRRA